MYQSLISFNNMNTEITETECGILIELPHKSWVLLSEYPENNDIFHDLWNLHPEEYSDVQVWGKMRKTPRYMQSYGKPYTFSKVLHEAKEIPEIMDEFFTYANNFIIENELWYEPYNQCLVNWYEDGNHYIGPHPDNEKELLVVDNRISVFSYTLLECESLDGVKLHKRTFRIKPKGKGKYRLDITLNHNMILIMGGELQNHYTHQIPTTKKKVSKRINITLRTFK